MRYKEPYSLFKKRLISGSAVYYYTYYDDFGRRKQLSTGCRLKNDARNYCINLFKQGSLEPTREVTFRQFTKNFFIYNQCLYIRSKQLRGHSYSRSNADRMRSLLVNHITPYFGNISLSKIKPVLVEEWLVKLQEKGLSQTTINHLLKELKLIFHEAHRQQVITQDPISEMSNIALNIKEKGIFKSEEIQKLTSPSLIKSIWNNNQLQYLFNRTAAETGMRMGEVQAILGKNLYEDHISVCHSWDRKYGLKGTKTGKERVVPINKELYDALKPLITNDNDFIFSFKGNDKPIDHKSVYKWFKRALEKIGITEEKRNFRNLTFHSYRHYFNTTLVAKGLPNSIVQAITGHSDDKMTEHYTHLGLEDLKVIL